MDPYETQRRLNDDTDDVENMLHDFWLALVSDSDGSPQNMALLAGQRQAQEVLGLREPLTAFNLRRFVARWLEKPRLGRKIIRDGTRYRVTPV